jgi:hypothetical protein
MNEVKFDMEKRSRAYKACGLRMIVALYMCYLAFKISSADDTSMSKTLCWIIGGIFMAAVIVFIIYSRKRFLIDLDAAKIKDDNTADDETIEAEAAVKEDSAESDASE